MVHKSSYCNCSLAWCQVRTFLLFTIWTHPLQMREYPLRYAGTDRIKKSHYNKIYYNIPWPNSVHHGFCRNLTVIRMVWPATICHSNQLILSIFHTRYDPYLLCTSYRSYSCYDIMNQKKIVDLSILFIETLDICIHRGGLLLVHCIDYQHPNFHHHHYWHILH